MTRGLKILPRKPLINLPPPSLPIISREIHFTLIDTLLDLLHARIKNGDQSHAVAHYAGVAWVGVGLALVCGGCGPGADMMWCDVESGRMEWSMQGTAQG